MSPEKRADHITTDNLNHSGDLDGAMQELPREGVPSVQELNTGELEQIAAPDTSEALILHDDERPEFQERLAALRESHASAETATEAGGYIPTGELPVAAEQKKGHGKLYAVIGAAAAAAAAAASLFLLPKGENNDKANVPAPTQPVASAEATPGATAPVPAETSQSTQTKAEQITSHEIKVNPSDEALSTDIVSKFSDWGMAGANQEAFDKFAKGTNASIEQIADDIAAEQGDIYATAIFGPNYKSNPEIMKTVTALIKINANNIRLYIRTFDPQYNPKNVERWNRQLLPAGLESSDTTSEGKKLIIDLTYKTNADKTYIGTDPTNGAKDRLIINLVAGQSNTYTASSIRFDSYMGN